MDLDWDIEMEVEARSTFRSRSCSPGSGFDVCITCPVLSRPPRREQLETYIGLRNLRRHEAYERKSNAKYPVVA